MEPLVRTAAELNERREWFLDDRTRESRESGPWVVVADDFYADPHRIRHLALAQEFVPYSPPHADQVGEEVADLFDGRPPSWFSSRLLRFRGKPVRRPHAGFRYAPTELRSKLVDLLGESIAVGTWDTLGDGWNGAFHWQSGDWDTRHAAIHHHFKDGDVAPRGWSGLVYLTPDPPPSAGTSIWQNRSSGTCIGVKGTEFEFVDPARHRLALRVENRFNRLVLFRENVLHQAGHGFGSSKHDARLTQTLFFHATAASQSPR